QLSRRLLHLVLAPVQLFPADGDQLLGRIRDHLGGQLDHQALTANRVADDVAGIAGTRGDRAAAPAANVPSPAAEALAAGATAAATLPRARPGRRRRARSLPRPLVELQPSLERLPRAASQPFFRSVKRCKRRATDPPLYKAPRPTR